MKLSFLNTLIVALRHTSLADAAKELNLTPSAVSIQMKALETHFGRPLFDRSARNVRPTAFAIEVAQVVRQSLDALEALRKRDDFSVSGTLRLGTVESIQATMLPLALQVLRNTASALKIELSRGWSNALQTELKAGRIDAAVLLRPPTGGSSRLRWFTLRRDRYVMIVPPEAREESPVELLRRYDWIRLDRAATGGRIAAQFVERIAPRTQCVFDLPSTDAIVAMVSAGLGVAVIPTPTPLMRSAHHFREVSLGKNGPTREIVFACRAADVENRGVIAALRAFESTVKKT